MKPDYINASFEFVAGLFILYNCWVLWNQKLVRGVSVISTTFFFLWGVWNLYWYPSLAQPWSFRGGLCIMFANCLYIWLMVYYKYCENSSAH